MNEYTAPRPLRPQTALDTAELEAKRVDNIAFRLYAQASAAMDPNAAITALDLDGDAADDMYIVVRDVVHDAARTLISGLEAAGFNGREKLAAYANACRWPGEDAAIARWTAKQAARHPTAYHAPTIQNERAKGTQSTVGAGTVGTVSTAGTAGAVRALLAPLRLWRSRPR